MPRRHDGFGANVPSNHCCQEEEKGGDQKEWSYPRGFTLCSGIQHRRVGKGKDKPKRNTTDDGKTHPSRNVRLSRLLNKRFRYNVLENVHGENQLGAREYCETLLRTRLGMLYMQTYQTNQRESNGGVQIVERKNPLFHVLLANGAAA